LRRKHALSHASSYSNTETGSLTSPSVSFSTHFFFFKTEEDNTFQGDPISEEESNSEAPRSSSAPPRISLDEQDRAKLASKGQDLYTKHFMNGFMDIRMQPSYQEFYRMKQVRITVFITTIAPKLNCLMKR
jgi:hypothetical protein